MAFLVTNMPLQVGYKYALPINYSLIYCLLINLYMYSADVLLFYLHGNFLLLVGSDDDMDKVFDVFVCLPINDIDIRRYWPYSWDSHEFSRKLIQKSM